MTPNITPRFGVKFLSRQERTVNRTTKKGTAPTVKRLQPRSKAEVEVKPKVEVERKEPKPPVPRLKVPYIRGHFPTPKPESERSKKARADLQAPRTLQRCDLEKLARLNCSREFSLFHQYIKSQLPKSFENQLAFLQTKLQHLKNEFINKQAEHLNFEQIREYYNQAAEEHRRKQLKSDEFLTLSEKYRLDIKQAIEKWLKKKELKPKPQITINSQRRREKIQERIKAAMEESKRLVQNQSSKEDGSTNSSQASSNSVSTTPAEITLDDDEIMIIE